MKNLVVRILKLLSLREHSLEELRLKLNASQSMLNAILEWGLVNGLWLKTPFSKPETYAISDAGELMLSNTGWIEQLMNTKPVSIPEREETEAPSLLKDPRLLCRIREVMDREIVGEYENKLLLFLILLSKDLGSEYAQACFIMGESSAGKSYLMHKVLSYFPEDCVIWLTRSTTHGLEYFLGDKDLNGCILAVEEAPGLSDAQQYIRPIFSERGLRIVSAQATGGGKVVSQVIDVKGCPAFVTTSCTPVIDEEMSTRVWILSIDESEEQTRRILEFEAMREKYPDAEGVGGEKEAIRRALSGLKPVKVLIPYADYIHFPSRRIRARRDFQKLLTIIKVSAYLHQYQRPRITVDGEEFVVATFADYNIAHTLVSKVLRPTILGLPEGVLKVYDVCKKLSEEGVEITSRSVTEGCGYSQDTVRKYLNRLVRARLLLKDETQKEHRFSIITAENVGLCGIHALKSRFSREEFEKWKSKIRDNGITYEEMEGTVYNPIPQSSMPKKSENEPSIKNRAEDAGFLQNPVSPTTKTKKE